jgi:catechol 2,3-dioxygenase-like lactoylglutathione lyase family enzyme
MSRFYRDAFGCEIISDRQGNTAALGMQEARLRCVSLSLGEQVVELSCFDPPGMPWPDHPQSNDFIFQHFAIAVSNMAKAYLHLMTTSGWTPISKNGPVQLPQSSGGVTAFKFRDPEGHPLELLEFPGKSAGEPPASGALFYEINHSAIVVEDTQRSLDFYVGALGLSLGELSVNKGSAQAHLDDLDDPLVRVTALQPSGQATPHVELLCYEYPESGLAPPTNKTAADAIATRMVFAADNMEQIIRRAVAAGGSAVDVSHHRRTALLRDPDGHDVMIEMADTSSVR